MCKTLFFNSPSQHWGTSGALLVVIAWLAFVSPVNAGDYEALAELVTSPLFSTYEEARVGYRDDVLVMRMELAHQGVRKIDPSDAELNRITTDVQRRLSDCNRSMKTIRELDNTTPDFEGLATKTLKAAPSLFRKDPNTQQLRSDDQKAVEELIAKSVEELLKAGVNKWQLSKEWEDYRRHYASVRKSNLQLAAIARARPCLYGIGLKYGETNDGRQSHATIYEVFPSGPAATAGVRAGDQIVAVDGHATVSSTGLDAAVLGRLSPAVKGSKVKVRILREGRTLDVDVTRSARLDNVKDMLSLRLDGSCDGAFDTDDLHMTNNVGIALTNCTVVVTLISEATGSRETREHIHFVKHWPAKKSLVAMYHNDSSDAVAQNETFKFVQNVNVKLYSDQFQGESEYEYWNSKDRFADLKDFVENNVTFKGQFVSETDGFFGKGDGLYHTDAGVRMTLHQAVGKGGAPKLSLRKINVKMIEGDKSALVAFPTTTWLGGLFEDKTLQSPKFNGLPTPDSFEAELLFHGTDYKYVVVFEP